MKLKINHSKKIIASPAQNTINPESFFSGIPKELISEILTHLPPNEQSVALVCREFHEVTREDRYWQLQCKKKLGLKLKRPKQNPEPGWAKHAFINEVSRRFEGEIMTSITQRHEIAKMEAVFISKQQLLIPGVIFQIVYAVLHSDNLKRKDISLPLQYLFRVGGGQLTGAQVFECAYAVLHSDKSKSKYMQWPLRHLFAAGRSQLTGAQVLACFYAVLHSDKFKSGHMSWPLYDLFRAEGSPLTGVQVLECVYAVLHSDKLKSKDISLPLQDIFRGEGSSLTGVQVLECAYAVLYSDKLFKILFPLEELFEAAGSQLSGDQVLGFAYAVLGSDKLNSADISSLLNSLFSAGGGRRLRSLLDQNSTFSSTEKEMLSGILDQF